MDGERLVGEDMAGEGLAGEVLAGEGFVVRKLGCGRMDCKKAWLEKD